MEAEEGAPAPLPGEKCVVDEDALSFKTEKEIWEVSLFTEFCRTSTSFYQKSALDGGIARNLNVLISISNKGALAHALNMVRNPPVDKRTPLFLRGSVD